MDLNAFPPDFPYDEYVSPSDSTSELIFTEKSYESTPRDSAIIKESDNIPSTQEYSIEYSGQLSVGINTELGLIQQEYVYDQRGNFSYFYLCFLHFLIH